MTLSHDCLLLTILLYLCESSRAQTIGDLKQCTSEGLTKCLNSCQKSHKKWKTLPSVSSCLKASDSEYVLCMQNAGVFPSDTASCPKTVDNAALQNSKEALKGLKAKKGHNIPKEIKQPYQCLSQCAKQARKKCFSKCPGSSPKLNDPQFIAKKKECATIDKLRSCFANIIS